MANRRFIANCFIRGFSSTGGDISSGSFHVGKRILRLRVVAAGLLLSPPQPQCVFRVLPTFFPVATRLPGSVRCREALTDSVPRNF
jgi:hypothetical protein